MAYYRRAWITVLRAALALTRHGFALPWPAAVYGAWLVLRANQHSAPGADNGPLVDALAALYAHVYGVQPRDVELAARQRALAMDDCDRWVREGANLESDLIRAVRAALVRSYAALLAAVHVG